jgi:REP-associated tyrosine transposase
MEYKKRKNTRKRSYDYSSVGYYFITSCTHNHQCIFANFVGEGFPLPHVYDKASLKLTDQGEIIKENITNLQQKYSTIQIDNYVIMPNHIHMILIITYDNGRENPSPTTTVGQIMGYFKYQTTKQINGIIKREIKKVWQRSYHDHIIRNEKDYQRIWQYNPQKWELDRYYLKN